MSIINENPMDVYLERRLQEWAEWLKTGNSLNIGYQRQSSIAMFHEGKTINSAGKPTRGVETHEEAEEMEKMIAQMSRYKPIMADCLRNYYLNQLSLRNGSKRLGISHVEYRINVHMAKQWLCGKLYG